MKNKQEFYSIVMTALMIITLADIALVYHLMTHVHMNGQLYEMVGMGQTQNGKDTLYFPVYKLKGDK